MNAAFKSTGELEPILSAAEVRELLEEAAVFERAGDFTGAVATAMYAVRVAPDLDSRDEAILALERHMDAEREWQFENLRRRGDSERREQYAARHHH